MVSYEGEVVPGQVVPELFYGPFDCQGFSLHGSAPLHRTSGTEWLPALSLRHHEWQVKVGVPDNWGAGKGLLEGLECLLCLISLPHPV